jgi:transcriptional regulator with XRE-family HTH domain
MSNDETRDTILGASLKKAREAAGLTGVQLAQRLGWAATTGKGKVSKLEGGRQTPTSDEISAWATATGVNERLRDQWLALAEQEREEQANYRARMAGGQQAIQRQYGDLASHTTRFTFFETFVFPRYLQTPEYMRAILQEHHDKHGTFDDVAAAVKERQGSVRLLLDDTKTFVFLLDEPLLRRTRFPASIMRPQLIQLMSVIGLPNVTLAIYPSLSRPVHSYTESSFEIFDDVAFIETALADERKLLADDVEILERLFARYMQDAVVNEDARPLIADALAALPAT